ncbi:MAG: hypothetical protein EXR07_12820 [Acetobacteraceae bacterium]|nr:hypothetical protein [Acetobacteraceae bacterium]
MTRWWMAALLMAPLLSACEGSIADRSDICMIHRERLKTAVASYVDVQPGISAIDLARQGVREIVPHLSQSARSAFGDGGYWVGLASPDPRSAGIAAAFSADIRTRQSGPLDGMAASFNTLTQCRQAAAKEARAQGADGRATASVAANWLEVGRLKYQIELDVADKGAVAASIWRGRVNEAAGLLAATLRADGANPATNPAMNEAAALVRRADDFIAAVKAGREDKTTFAH